MDNYEEGEEEEKEEKKKEEEEKEEEFWLLPTKGKVVLTSKLATHRRPLSKI